MLTVKANAEPETASEIEREPTSLYAKVFIDGFSKPSCIVLTSVLSGRMPAALGVSTFESLVEDNPPLRSRVERSRLGVPTHFRRCSTAAWRAAGSISVHEPFDLAGLGAFERGLLGTRLDPEKEFPFQVWILQGEEAGRPVSAVVIKAHHAIVDAHAGKRLLLEYVTRWRAAMAEGVNAGERARARANGALPKREVEAAVKAPWQQVAARARRAWEWARAADLSGRVPDVSLLSSYRPTGALYDLAVTFEERVLPEALFERVRTAAARRDLTFSHALCISLLRAMRRYNQDEVARAPQRSLPDAMGLMIAVTRRWPREAAGAVRFEADTRMLSVPDSMFAPARAAELEALVRDAHAVRRGGHNDVSLALLYASRRVERLATKLRGKPRALDPVPHVHFTLSDLTGGALRLRGAIELPLPGAAPATPPLRVETLRTLVSPFAPAHAGLIATVYGGRLRLTLLHHEGAVRGDDLLDGLVGELERHLEQRSSESEKT